MSVRDYHGKYGALFKACVRRDKKEIALATPERSTFFHELSHTAHEKVKGGLKPRQDSLQEIVAELAAQALCRLVGRRPITHWGTVTAILTNTHRKLTSRP